MNRTDDEIRQDVVDYVPRWYEEFTEVIEILDARAEEFVKVNADVRDVLNQYFVDRATWGLSEWERIFKIRHDEPRTIEERRAVIKSHMRGAGTTTLAMIKNVAESYDGGEVDVENDSATFTITITFIGTRGIPSNLSDTEQALRDIIPAHLAIGFEFTYLSWGELDVANLTWGEIDALGLTWEQFERFKPNI